MAWYGSFFGAALILGLVFSLFREAFLEIRVERIDDFDEIINRHKPERLQKMLRKPNEIAAALTIIKAVLYFAAFFYAYKLSRYVVGDIWKVLYFAAVISVIIVLFEFVPQVIGYKKHLYLLKRLLSVLNFIRFLVRPVTLVLKFISGIIVRVLGSGSFRQFNYVSDEEIELLIEGSPKHKQVEEMEKDMLSGIIEFRDTVVREVMVPRINMVSISADTQIADSIESFVTSGHSRIPVFDERIDNITGILYAKDILYSLSDPQKKKDIAKNIMRKPIFVPENKKLNELLLEFKQKKAHLAIVVDEYGGTAGLVTIEDILEEIVGEIEDEYDTNEKKRYKKIKDNIVETEAQVDIDELNEEFDLDIPTDELYESIGGFIVEHLGYVPAANEKITIDDYAFEILSADEKHIKKLRIKKQGEKNEED